METKQNKSCKNQYQLAADTSRSQEQIQPQLQDPFPTNNKPHQKKYILASTGLAGLVGLLYLLYHHYVITNIIPDQLVNSQYKFQIYCPINKLQHPLPTSSNLPHQFTNTVNDLRVLTTQILTISNTTIDQYIIFVQMRRVSDKSNVSKLFFCSFVTDWDTPNCSTAEPICTVPGPILYAERNKPIEVAWVYDIKNENGQKHFSLSFGPCMNASAFNNTDFCWLQQKKAGYQSCTYRSPTDLAPTKTLKKSFHITPQNIPIVTHIHGLEVRPALDGNPLAWMGANGETGPAFLSLMTGEKYFSNGLFKNSYSTPFLAFPGMNHTYAKVNRYQNRQNPGNLWYHDHSMHITQDNVGHGLLGNYLIYDPLVEDQLPGREYDIFIVAGQHMLNSTTIHAQTKVYHQLQLNPSIPFYSQPELKIMRNQTYRIRILNGNFDSVFTNLRFKTQCLIISGQPVDVSTCRKTLKFSVIGSDSSLFNRPVYNVTQLNISSAQRFEILIIFDGNMGSVIQNPISGSANRVILVDLLNQIKHQFLLLPKTSIPNHYNRLPSQLIQIKGVHFYDLVPVNRLCAFITVLNPTLCISKLRMKPIFKKNHVHFFNGHYDFTKSGRTDNPKIGTTEDWVFISLTHRHPIHVHLINFQIIGTTTLKNFTVNMAHKNQQPFYCTFYEMDYWVASGLLAPSNNYTQLCIESMAVDILNKTTQDILNKAFPQDQINHDNSSVVGFDVFKQVANESQRVKYNTDSDCVSNFKYICAPVSNKEIPEEYRRWKDTALLNNHTVLVLRLRWTSSDYLVQSKSSYPYFHTPQDELIQYPGYVYHCHFLQHEDNKLMRSFQMQPSDKFDANYNVTGTPLGDCMVQKGLGNQGGWSSRYKCINELCGCPYN